MGHLITFGGNDDNHRNTSPVDEPGVEPAAPVAVARLQGGFEGLEFPHEQRMRSRNCSAAPFGPVDYRCLDCHPAAGARACQDRCLLAGWISDCGQRARGPQLADAGAGWNGRAIRGPEEPGRSRNTQRCRLADSALRFSRAGERMEGDLRLPAHGRKPAGDGRAAAAGACNRCGWKFSRVVSPGHVLSRSRYSPYI